MSGDFPFPAYEETLAIGVACLVAAVVTVLHSRRNAQKALLLIPLLLFFCSLLFVAFNPETPTRVETQFGYRVLCWGWLGLIGALFGWFANIFLLLAYIGALSDNVAFARKMAIAAAIVSLDSFRVLSQGLPLDGAPLKIHSFGPGAYLWFAAIFAALVISFLFHSPSSNPPLQGTPAGKPAAPLS